jgi:hypothetical protein
MLMHLVRLIICTALFAPGLLGCGDAKTVIPTGDFTGEQKQAIMAEDAKIADEESQGKRKKK